MDVVRESPAHLMIGGCLYSVQKTGCLSEKYGALSTPKLRYHLGFPWRLKRRATALPTTGTAPPELRGRKDITFVDLRRRTFKGEKYQKLSINELKKPNK